MKVAAITGAAQGIGARIAEVLSAEGFELALFDRQAITAYPQSLVFAGDVTDEGDVADFAAAVTDRFGQIDVLVNNAGIACISPADETPVKVWRQVIDVNLTGSFLMCQACIGTAHARGWSGLDRQHRLGRRAVRSC